MNAKKVTIDMLYEQMKWAFIFLSVILLIQISFTVISLLKEFSRGDFLLFSYNSTPIFMLIIGIISAYSFLPTYVKQGVTRKDYFLGGTLSGAGVAVGLTVSSILITLIEHEVIGLLNAETQLDTWTNQMGGTWLSAFVFYCFSIIIFYYIGWLIGVGYYRYGWVVGFGFIAVAIVFMMVTDFLWESEVWKNSSDWLPLELSHISVMLSVVGSLIVITVLLILIRTITRRIRIKM
ncbi:hypothetical protein [Alkalibacillus aidingensis]|uniref:hypothetical protein n=1 Tax=Alkalibacillus aidingensis TaxID=2747607 RepID=UPI0016613D7D|nr:hypothetical protein [Alkalibacillus aidingensis]